jgi:AcrR family transcriptional regulator
VSTEKKKRSSTGGSYHHGDLRNALLEAAMKLLEENGPAAVGLRETARRAGVTHGAPYRHFENREALLAAMATRGFDTLKEKLGEEATKSKVPARLVLALGRTYIDFARAHPALYLLMFGPGIRRDQHPDLQASSDAAIDVIREVIGQLPGVQDKRSATLGAWALAHGLSHLIADHQLPLDIAEGAPLDALVTNILKVYISGLA